MPIITLWQRNVTPRARQCVSMHAAVKKNSEDEWTLAVRLLRAANRFYARVYHQVEIILPCRLPKTGAAILVCNHTSGLDPHLIQSVCPRLITWMMAREYYEIRAIKPAMEALGVIPVTRSGRDMSATRAAMRAL